MSNFVTPRVFVSAASSDLRSAREVVNKALTRIECLPIEESVFGTEYGPIHKMLARRIESCQAVIHLVGRDYGGEPDPLHSVIRTVRSRLMPVLKHNLLAL